ncbi:TapB family protein [Zavarzinella formosa]|uniref:TapB family protein n=1 Tax=Zavarzinella formosa TaxID=360055 RepID=UPI000366F991|nr:hypothetical protein [Zavarzinella formosa]
MSRLLVICFVLVLAIPADSAPRLKDERTGPYYPAKVRDRWVMEIRNPDSTVEITEVVTAVETKDGATIVSIGREVAGNVGPEVSQMRISEKGLFRMSQLGTVFIEPYCVLQFPLKPGATWTAEANRGGTTPLKLQYKMAKEEDVEVPAGKFKAFRIDVEYESSGAARRSSLWYAPAVGVVKDEHAGKDGGYARVMKSFTPGK